jgi:hypothetical protein
MLSGRAIVYPTYKGTYKRNTGQTSIWPNASHAYEEWIIQVVNDARRSIDYAMTRDDFRHDSLAFVANSWGSFFGTRLLAVEPRVKTSVLMADGLQGERPAPSVDNLNFVTHITMPVLMVKEVLDWLDRYQGPVQH